MAVDLIVIHRSCSSLRVSVKRCSPALAAEMIPARWTRESVRVDFPWSTSPEKRMLVTTLALYIDRQKMAYHEQ